MAKNDPWSDHLETQFWAYLSSFSINPNLAYITYFESPFGSNAGTWAKEFFFLREIKNFIHCEQSSSFKRAVKQ